MDEQLQKYFLGELNASEYSELMQRLESDQLLRAQFIEFQNANALLQLSHHPGDEEDGKKNYLEFVEQIRRRNLRKRILQISKYAAIVVLLITSTWWLTYSYYQKPFVKTETANTLYVPAGQRARLMLQDGTEVWLSALSTLTYPSVFSGNERRVSLVGEAFFDVGKDNRKPFIVSAKDVEIKALGTRFNVHSYPNTKYVATSLIEGSVNVSIPGAFMDSVTLLPDQEVLVENGKMKVSNIDHYSYFLWKDGIYSFYNEPFGDIIAKLELYYDVKINVKDPSILNFVYTGKFRQRDGVDEILRIIQKIHRFKITKNEDRSTFTLSK